MNAMLLSLAMVLVLTGAAAAFEGEQQLHEAAKKEGQLTWYVSHFDSETAAAVCAGFEKKYPGVKCNYVHTTAQDQKAGLAQASVISTTDVGHYGRMKKDGWLQPYKPRNAAELVETFAPYNDPEHHFVITSAGMVLITYNSTLVSEKDAPKKWTDLLDPKWKGKVSIGHPGFSGYVGTWVVLMRKLYGWDYFKKLELNKPRIGRSINDTVTMLNAKESWVASGPSATTLESKDKGNPLAVVYPEDGTLLMVAPSGVVKNAPHPNAGKLLIEYLLSRECGDIMVKQSQDPVNKHVKPGAGGKPLNQIKTIRPTYDEILKGVPEVIEQFRDTFGV